MTVYIVCDADDRPMATFTDKQVACDYAEDPKTDAMFVIALRTDGSRKRLARFWCATLDHGSCEIKVKLDDLYRAGSLTIPCRHGWSLGASVSQDLSTSAAWAATKREAIRRVKNNESEARRRAARDIAYRRVEDEGRAMLKKQDEAAGTFSWDPYGLWMSRFPGLAERAEAEADKAYKPGTCTP